MAPRPSLKKGQSTATLTPPSPPPSPTPSHPLPHPGAPIIAWQANIVPESILQTCIKVSNEPPSDMKSNMRRAFAAFTPEQCDRPSTPAKRVAFRSILFGLCFYHSLLLGRKKFGTGIGTGSGSGLGFCRSVGWSVGWLVGRVVGCRGRGDAQRAYVRACMCGQACFFAQTRGLVRP